MADDPDLKGTNDLGPEWKPFALTHVVYRDGDLVGQVLAFSSLLPLAIMVAYGTLVLFRRDLCTMCALAGHLLNELLNLVLKHSVREARPVIPGVPMASFGKYGFPSNHAQFICFFAAFNTLLLIFRLKQNGSLELKLWRRFYALSCWVLAVVVAAGRLYLGQHTVSQVLWGCGIGAAFGVVWFLLLHYALAPLFPQIASWTVCEWLLIRDTTLIPNILFFEYTCARSEGRARGRKHSLKQGKSN